MKPSETARAAPTGQGVKILFHYARLAKQPKQIFFQATLYQGKQIVVLDEQALQPDDRHANWLSQGVEDTETIQLESSDKVKINREGIVITNGQLPSGTQATPHFLYPLSEEKVWQVGVE